MKSSNPPIQRWTKWSWSQAVHGPSWITRTPWSWVAWLRERMIMTMMIWLRSASRGTMRWSRNLCLPVLYWSGHLLSPEKRQPHPRWLVCPAKNAQQRNSSIWLVVMTMMTNLLAHRWNDQHWALQFEEFHRKILTNPWPAVLSVVGLILHRTRCIIIAFILNPIYLGSFRMHAWCFWRGLGGFLFGKVYHFSNFYFFFNIFFLGVSEIHWLEHHKTICYYI